MIYGLMKITTTLFLLFALCCFIWGSVSKRNDASSLSGNIVVAFSVLNASLYMWR